MKIAPPRASIVIRRCAQELSATPRAVRLRRRTPSLPNLTRSAGERIVAYDHYFVNSAARRRSVVKRRRTLSRVSIFFAANAASARARRL